MTTKNENAELLARLQAEGRAPKVGDVVTRCTGSHSRIVERLTVDKVRARKLKYKIALYITANGVDFSGGPDGKAWRARRDIGPWSTDSIGPFDRAAHDEQDERRACNVLRDKVKAAANAATSKQLRAALAALAALDDEVTR